MSPLDVVRDCRYRTERLVAEPWSALPAAQRVDLVVGLLQPTVTAHLPPTWRIRITRAEAPEWIAERDDSGLVLAWRPPGGPPIGILTLQPPRAHDDALAVGYVLLESTWARGFATEGLAGFIAWQRAHAPDLRLVTVVETAHVASIRVLEKCGFVRTGTASDGLASYALNAPA